MLSVLFHRAENIADAEHQDEELKTLQKVFAQNGYSQAAVVDRALAQKRMPALMQRENEEEPIRGVLVVPF